MAFSFRQIYPFVAHPHSRPTSTEAPLMILLCRGAFGALLMVTLLGFGIPSTVVASCDVIPSATTIFAGTLGTSDRPFASPNDAIEIALRPCDATTPHLTDAAGFTA